MQGRKYTYDIDYFYKIDTPDKAYWLGFLYADGAITKFYKKDGTIRSMTLEISLKYEDKIHLEKFRECIKSDVPIFERIIKLNGKEYKSARIQINNTRFCRNLCNVGCIPQKTYKLEFPSNNIVPHPLMRDFIRGFFDGDGCICTYECAGSSCIVSTITGRPEMLHSIVDYLISQSVIRTMPAFIKKSKQNFACDVRFSGKDNNKDLLDYLYKDSNLYLDRKYNKYIDYYKNYNDKKTRGVYYNSKNNSYIANIRINGKKKLIYCKTYEEAVKKRKELEIEKMKYKQPT